MVSLKCSVENCGNNCSGLCRLNEIDVSGAGAKHSEATCCSSFHEGGATNSFVEYAVPETYVKCTATNCKHNEDCNCHADGIDVCGCGASKAEYTECGTFCEKSQS